MDRESLDRGTARTAAELRLQLAQMTAASQLLERSARDEKSRGYLAALNQSICRMLRVVGRMELTARLTEDGTPRLEMEAADLGGLLDELGERMAVLLESAGVRLSVRGPGRLSAQADEGMVRQLLLELVANGARAGSEVTVTLERRGDSAVFTVEDNGPGIPPERLAYLFSSREEEMPDWRRGGTGVAVARRIAVLHGGTLMAGCAAGRGLRVAASIPLDEPAGGGMKSPGLRWDRGGFDEAVVTLSGLLPAAAFAPEAPGDGFAP